MKISRWLTVMMVGVIANGMITLSATADDAKTHRLGGGVHYWTSVPRVDLSGMTINGEKVESKDRGDDDGVSWLLTYQYRPGLIGLGVDVEWKESGYVGSTKDVFEPQLYAIVGTWIYAAAGIGGYYYDGRFANKAFGLLRAGVDLPLTDSLYVDLHAMWRFEQWDSIKKRTTDDESDSFAVGASLRYAF